LNVLRYFDNRQNEWRTFPDCASHGLRWNAIEQRCERGGDWLFGGMGAMRHTTDQHGLGLLAIDDYDYLGDYGGGGGGYLGNGYGGDDFYSGFLYDPGYYDTSLPGGTLPDIPLISPTLPDLGIPEFGEIPFYYDPITGQPILGTGSEHPGEIPPPPISTPNITLIPPTLPDFTFPLPIDFGADPFGAGMTYGPNLPPYCPPGYYHPIDNPQSCVPFPPATTPPTQPPSGGAPKPPPIAPPAQQGCPSGQYPSRRYQRCMPIPNCAQLYPGSVFSPASEACVAQGACPPGYWPNPKTRQCELIPQCPGANVTFDMTRGICVPITQGQGSLFDEIPWWLWLGLLAVLLLSSGGNGERTTTIRHRRAS